MNDLILDKNGQKMSKSKGNTVEPIALMHEFGADAIRWYLLEVSPPWVPTRFDVDGVKEIVSKFIGTLKNVYSFYATYANIDSFDASAYPQDWQRESQIDRWIVSRLHTLTGQVRGWMAEYEFTKVVRAIQDFVIDELSNWHVRRSRRRFWAMELTADKVEAYRTLHQVLVEVVKLAAPFAPYLTEEIFLSLGAGKVFTLRIPRSDPQWIDANLEAEMGGDHRPGLSAAPRATMPDCANPGQDVCASQLQATADAMFDLIQEEVNIRQISYVAEDDDFVHYELNRFKVAAPNIFEDESHRRRTAEYSRCWRTSTRGQPPSARDRTTCSRKTWRCISVPGRALSLPARKICLWRWIPSSRPT